jgi:predicted SnoaL-like aldol condensation-catalyzing enzyme
MSRPARTAREVAGLYTLSLWNERNFELADELIADTVIQHGVGEAHVLTREQILQSIQQTWAKLDELRFNLDLVIAGDDGQHVAVLYDSRMMAKDGTQAETASVEVLRVVDGQITEVWYAPSQLGAWL